MAVRQVLLPVLLLAAGASAGRDSDYDYFLFVRQWGVTFCESGACAIKPVERFSIHGLWPERNDHTWPQCCDGRYRFEMEKIAPLLRDLVYYWFSYTRGIKEQCQWGGHAPALLASAAAALAEGGAANMTRAMDVEEVDYDDDYAEAVLEAIEAANATAVRAALDDAGSPDYQFWKHEWEKHGTCALDVFSDEYRYFKTVLKLGKKYDLDAILSDAGIVPSAKPYATRDVLAAVRGATGYQPTVSCRGGQLSELTMCVNKDLDVVDCPGADAAENWGCGAELRIPPADDARAEE